MNAVPQDVHYTAYDHRGQADDSTGDQNYPCNPLSTQTANIHNNPEPNAALYINRVEQIERTQTAKPVSKANKLTSKT